MMLRKKSNPWMRAKALYTFPVALIALGVFATPLMNSPKETEEKADALTVSKVTEIIPNQEIFSKENSVTEILTSTETPTIPESSASDETAIAEATNNPIVEESKQSEKEVVLIKQDKSDITASSSPTSLTPDSIPPLKTDKDVNRKDGDPIFDVCEVMPEYPGGFEKLMSFLQMNLRYPEKAQKNGVQGRIYISFIVEKDGRCTEFNIVRKEFDPISAKDSQSEAGENVTVVGYEKDNPNPLTTKASIEESQNSLCDEALRVCKLLGPFTPGKQRGENVRVNFTLPIVFRLR